MLEVFHGYEIRKEYSIFNDLVNVVGYLQLASCFSQSMYTDKLCA